MLTQLCGKAFKFRAGGTLQQVGRPKELALVTDMYTSSVRVAF